MPGVNFFVHLLSFFGILGAVIYLARLGADRAFLRHIMRDVVAGWPGDFLKRFCRAYGISFFGPRQLRVGPPIKIHAHDFLKWHIAHSISKIEVTMTQGQQNVSFAFSRKCGDRDTMVKDLACILSLSPSNIKIESSK